MTERTCAVCDGVIVGDGIKVTIGGRTLEVCCETCSRKLKEASAVGGDAR